MCEAALPQGESDLAKGLAATPGPSWAEADLQLLPPVLASQVTNEGGEGFAAHAILEGDAGNDGDESADSELLFSDDEEDESIFLTSCKAP